MRRFLKKLAVWSITLFLLSTFWLGSVESRSDNLNAERERKFEWGSMVEMTARSFWNGVTLGAFSGGDIFAESTRLNNWADGMHQQEGALNNESSLATLLWKISFVTSAGSLGTLYFLRRRRLMLTKASLTPNTL